MAITGPQIFVIVCVTTWLLISGLSALPAQEVPVEKVETHKRAAPSGLLVAEPTRFLSFPEISSKLQEFRQTVTEKIASAVLALLSHMGVEIGLEEVKMPQKHVGKVDQTSGIRVNIKVSGRVPSRDSKGENVRILGHDLGLPQGDVKIVVEADKIADGQNHVQRDLEEDKEVFDLNKILMERRLGDGLGSVVHGLSDISRGGEGILPLSFPTKPKPVEVPHMGSNDEAKDSLDHGDGLDTTKKVLHSNEKHAQTEDTPQIKGSLRSEGFGKKTSLLMVDTDGTKGMDDTRKLQSVDDRVRSLEQDTQEMMQQERDMENLIDQSLEQLRDWMKSETNEETINIPRKVVPAEDDKLQIFNESNNDSTHLKQGPRESMTEQHASSQKPTLVKLQVSLSDKNTAKKDLPESNGVLNLASYFTPGGQTLEEKGGVKQGKAGDLTLRPDASQDAVVKTSAINTNNNKKPVTMRSFKLSHEHNTYLPVEDKPDTTDEGKNEDKVRQDSVNKVSTLINDAKAPAVVAAILHEKKMRPSSSSLINKINKESSKTESPKSSPESWAPEPRRAKRDVSNQPLTWSWHDNMDKTQRRSAKEQEQVPSGESEKSESNGTQDSEASKHGQTPFPEASDFQNDSSIFEIGYQRFLHKLALKEHAKDAKEEVQEIKPKNASDENNAGQQENGENSSGDSGTQSIDADLSFKVEPKSDTVSLELSEPVLQAQPGAVYEIRDDDDDNDNFDDWIETLEFRRRRAGSRNGKRDNDKKRKSQRTFTRKRGRSHTQRQNGFNGNERSEAEENFHAKEDENSVSNENRVGQRRRVLLSKHRPTSGRDVNAKVKEPRQERSVKSEGNVQTGKKNETNHTLLDDADIVFIVKHKQPVRTSQRKNKSSAAVESNSSKGQTTAPVATNHLQRDPLSFLKTFYHIKSSKKKTAPGKVSRHVPHETASPSTKKAETTSRPPYTGPSVKRLTPPPPFPIHPMHPGMHPLHAPFNHGSRPVNMVYKHHGHANRHGAAILVFLSLGILLFMVMVLALSKASNNIGEPQRNDSSTALYVNYPHY